MRAWWLGVLAAIGCSSPKHELAFEKHLLDAEFRSEAVAVFDVNQDGHADIVTDQYWYAGPSFTPHEIRAPETYDPATGYSHGFAAYPWDVDGDGWLDLINIQLPGTETYWYRNPGGADGHWDRFLLTPNAQVGLETPIAVDLFGTGGQVLLASDMSSSTLGWFEPGPDPTQPWVMHPISGAGFPAGVLYAHGIGMGDVDGDGRQDVLTGWAWFGQTADPGVWIQHDFPFGPNRCSQLHATDVDGDGRADVFCSAPHDYGFDWWHQEPDGTFTSNLIDDTISQMHALELEDLDGDKVPELITGKRWWAHGPYFDTGAGDPGVLTVYRRVGTGAAAGYVRMDLDQDSGIGTSFAVADVDGDGRKDIVVSNKHGLSWFRSL